MGKNIEQRVTELEKMVKKLADEKGVKFRKKLGEGDTFEAIGLTWTILKITEKGYMCLADRLEESKKFGSNNDWKNSSIRNISMESSMRSWSKRLEKRILYCLKETFCRWMDRQSMGHAKIMFLL